MKRMLLAVLVLVAFCAAVLLAQSGPKREEKKAKPDTTSAATSKKEEPVKKEEVKKEPVKTPPPPPVSAPAKVQESVVSPAKPATPPPPPMVSTSVARAVITRAIVDREPAAPVDTLGAPVDSVYFFTELVGMEGQTVMHRWKLGDEVVVEVPIAVRASHWRAYSKKRLIAAWAGVWTVEVVGADGNVVASKSFVYRPH